MVDESNEIMGLLFGDEQDDELVTHPAILPVVTVDEVRVECMMVILLLLL